MADFKLARYRIRTQDGGNRPDAPFSVVFLSDQHDSCYGAGNERLLKEIRDQRPEAVFIGGDMLTASKNPSSHGMVALLGELTKYYPVYYANGNHECRLRERRGRFGDFYDTYSETIRSFGVYLLENECVRTRIRGMNFTIWGLELPLDYFTRLQKRELLPSQMERLLGKKPEDGSFHLMLAHTPAYFADYAAWGADLVLSGHYHGGLVRLPVLGGMISPQLELFPKYCHGLYQENQSRLIVSAGLGSHTINMRINNPPELVVVDFL